MSRVLIFYDETLLCCRHAVPNVPPEMEVRSVKKICTIYSTLMLGRPTEEYHSSRYHGPIRTALLILF